MASTYASRHLPQQTHTTQTQAMTPTLSSNHYQAMMLQLQYKCRNSPSIKVLKGVIVEKCSKENKNISMKILKNVLFENQIVLLDYEVEFIEKKCSSVHGGIDCDKLLELLDIGLPENYVDPSQQADSLPQPYRMIAKLLEMEIIDRAWLDIQRNHPEVKEEIPGQLITTRKNKNLEKECYPSSQSDRFQNIELIVEGGNSFIACTSGGLLFVTDAHSGKILTSLQLYAEDGESDSQQQEHTILYLNATSDLVHVNQCRCVVGRIKANPAANQPSSEQKPVADQGKKLKTKTSVPIVEQVVKVEPFLATFYIVDIVRVSDSESDSRLLSKFDCKLDGASLFAEFSNDCLALTIASGDRILFYTFPAISANANSGADMKMSGIKEDSLMENAGEELKTSRNLEPQCSWNIKEEINSQFKSSRCNLDKVDLLIQECHIFSFQSEITWNNGKKLADDSASNLQQIKKLQKPEISIDNCILILFHNLPRIFVFGLKYELNPNNLETMLSEMKFQLELLRQWELSSLISASTLDDDRSLLVTGLYDGTVISWNLKSLLQVDYPVKHFNKVTSVCLAEGTDAHYLVTGATDGTICFSQFNSDGYVKVSKAKLVGFREDFSDAVLKVYKFKNLSLVVVFNAAGLFAIYDVDSGDLLGRLSFTTGIPGLKVEFSFLATQNVVTKLKSLVKKVPIEGQAEPATEIITPSQEYQEAIASSSRHGIAVLLGRKDAKSLICHYNADKIITSLCPGVQKLLNDEKYTRFTVKALYKMMLPKDRLNQFLDANSVHFSTDHRSTASETTYTKKTLGSRSTSKPIKKNSVNPNGTAKGMELTEQGLKDLQQAFFPFNNIPELPPISSNQNNKLIPRRLVEDSLKRSQNERTRRKFTVLQSMQDIGSLF